MIQAIQPIWGRHYNVGYLMAEFNTKSTFSRGIAYLTRGEKEAERVDISHVSIISGPDACVEAREGVGVVENSILGRFQDKHKLVYFRKPVGYTEELGQAIVDEIMQHVGEDYDNNLIAAHAISGSALGRMLNRLTSNAFEESVSGLFNDPSKWICSEIAANAYDAQPQLKDIGILKQSDHAIVPRELFIGYGLWEPYSAKL